MNRNQQHHQRHDPHRYVLLVIIFSMIVAVIYFDVNLICHILHSLCCCYCCHIYNLHLTGVHKNYLLIRSWELKSNFLFTLMIGMWKQNHLKWTFVLKILTLHIVWILNMYSWTSMHLAHYFNLSWEVMDLSLNPDHTPSSKMRITTWHGSA